MPRTSKKADSGGEENIPASGTGEQGRVSKLVETSQLFDQALVPGSPDRPNLESLFAFIMDAGVGENMEFEKIGYLLKQKAILAESVLGPDAEEVKRMQAKADAYLNAAKSIAVSAPGMDVVARSQHTARTQPVSPTSSAIPDSHPADPKYSKGKGM